MNWRKRTMKIKAIFLSLLTLIVTSVAFSIGYASWQYSSSNETTNNIAVNIQGFNFWVDSDVLDEDTYQYSEDFIDALNGLDDPNSEQGQALADAIEQRKNTSALFFFNSDEVGNMDDNTGISNDLKKVLNVKDGCSYIIKINTDGTYELYVTYVNLSSKNYGDTIEPVYKTVYEKNANGEYRAVQSYKGSSVVARYSSGYFNWQKSFSTSDFTANS